MGASRDSKGADALYTDFPLEFKSLLPKISISRRRARGCMHRLTPSALVGRSRGVEERMVLLVVVVFGADTRGDAGLMEGSDDEEENEEEEEEESGL